MHFSKLFEAGLRSGPERPAVLTADGERALTFGELDRLSASIAGRLARRGARPGDRVFLVLGNVPETFAAIAACARIGAIAVPLDPSLKPSEIDILAAHAAPAASIDARWLDGIGAEAPLPLERPLDPSEPFVLFYTSGTTGAPKGVLHSHGMLWRKLQAFGERWELGPEHRALCVLPLYFIHALMMNTWPVLAAGGSIVLAPPLQGGALRGFGELVDRFGIDSFSAVPTILRLLLENARPPRRKLAFTTCASAPLPPELLARFERAFDTKVIECYGLTETSIVAMSSPALRTPGSVGRAFDAELTILDEDGNPAVPGAPGEIAVRGSVMEGYFQRPDLTAASTCRGWFRTGDLGRLDADGNLFLAGRLKDMIIRSGVKLYPDEIDALIGRHPAVFESATLGIPNELRGERAVSFVVPKSGARLDPASLREHCRAFLSDSRCPDEFRLIGSIPKTSRGKVDRKALCSMR